MTDVIFYEKPGCANNARQKQLLEKAGHRLDVRNLLEEPWTAEALRSYFGDKPVVEWFNKAAPEVKSNAVDPSALGVEEALALMLADPILIRRPLIEAKGERTVGFDTAVIDGWIGLSEAPPRSHDLEICRRRSPSQAPSTDESPAR